MKNHVTWYIRAQFDENHGDVGRTLSEIDDTINEEQLHRGMMTSDGSWPLWDFGNWKFEKIKDVVISFLRLGVSVYLYRQVNDEIPILFKDRSIESARRKMVKEFLSKKRKPKKIPQIH